MVFFMPICFARWFISLANSSVEPAIAMAAALAASLPEHKSIPWASAVRVTTFPGFKPIEEPSTRTISSVIFT